MWNWRQIAAAAVFTGIVVCGALAQQDQAAYGGNSDPANSGPSAFSATSADNSKETVSRDKKSKGHPAHAHKSTLNSDDRMAVIAAALDSKRLHRGGRDCSHLVHSIYQRAGFPYQYASSEDLYEGVDGFQRVSAPDVGDLVVWRGHAGIVIRPSKHVFFSFLTAGPGIDDYTSRYWRGRGDPRFFRYMKHERVVANR